VGGHNYDYPDRQVWGIANFSLQHLDSLQLCSPQMSSQDYTSFGISITSISFFLYWHI